MQNIEKDTISISGVSIENSTTNSYALSIDLGNLRGVLMENPTSSATYHEVHIQNGDQSVNMTLKEFMERVGLNPTEL